MRRWSFLFCPDPDNVNILEAAVTPPGESWFPTEFISIITIIVVMFIITIIIITTTITIQVSFVRSTGGSSKAPATCSGFQNWKPFNHWTGCQHGWCIIDFVSYIHNHIFIISNLGTRSCFRASLWQHFTRWARNIWQSQKPRRAQYLQNIKQDFHFILFLTRCLIFPH